MTASATVPLQEVPQCSLEPLDRTMKVMAEERARKELKLVEENVGAHVVPSSDDELVEAWMARVAAHEVEFDRFGVPTLPTAVCHPDDYQRFEAALNPATWSHAVRTRWRALIERKREEFLARETRRSLAG